MGDGNQARSIPFLVALFVAIFVVPAAHASLPQAPTPPSDDSGPTPASHCDVSGSVLVPQASKATTVTHFGVGALNGVVNYRITCVHPDSAFRLTYDDRPLNAICAGDDVAGVDLRAALVDFDILFWPPGTVVRPIKEFRACGDEAGTVPFAAAFADVVLIGGVPGAQFSYEET